MRLNQIYDLLILGGLMIIFTVTGCYRYNHDHTHRTALPMKTGGNPVIDEGSADPSVGVFDDRIYIYPSHDYSRDNEFRIMKDWKVYSSPDLVNFTDHGIVLDGKNVAWAVDPDHCWAPDCAGKDGRYYFYFPVSDKEGIWKGKIGVTVADHPWGPFRDALGYPLIDDNDKSAEYRGGYYNIDPAAFTDDDGRSYLFWGNGVCFMAELNKDMTSLKSEIRVITVDGNQGYAEGPFFWKKRGIYYLLYSRTGSSSFDLPDYATSTVYGLNEKQINIHKYLKLWLSGDPLKIPGSITNLHRFITVDDLHESYT